MLLEGDLSLTGTGSFQSVTGPPWQEPFQAGMAALLDPEPEVEPQGRKF